MKFNQKPSLYNTTNRCGEKAIALSDKEHLMSAVLTTMYGEPKFYGSTDNDIVLLATELCATNPDFVAKLAVYARKEMNLRSVSHVLTCVIAYNAKEYTRQVIRNIVVRTDDVTEIMSCYKQMYGKPFPNAMKREMAEVVKKFDEYQFAKHKDGALKMRDVFRIVHPKPDSEEMNELFNKVINDTLETPLTWEVLVSKNKNKPEVWNQLMRAKKLPYMAMLRNLANISEVMPTEEELKPYMNYLTNPNAVKNSKQLPFRYYSAYRTLKKKGMLTTQLSKGLDTALKTSVQNLPKFKGRTLIAVDASGSMGWGITEKKSYGKLTQDQIKCSDIANLIGALSAYMCEEATVCRFSSNYDYFHDDSYKGYEIIHVSKYDNILECVDNMHYASGGTDIGLPMHYALEEDPARENVPYDRIIYLSDNECNTRSYGRLQSLLDRYKQQYNKDVIFHGVDLLGYGTVQTVGKNVNFFAGWSERLLELMSLVENGMGSMVEIIEAYELH